MHDWFNALSEGVIFIEEGRVTQLNAAAATFLEVDPNACSNVPLMKVLRDHRLERAYLTEEEVEIFTRGRMLRVRYIQNGLSLTDITELNKAQEGARELLAVLSHELRTPVTTMRAVLEAFHYDLTPEEEAHFLARAEAEVARLGRLLDDLTVDVRPPDMRRIDLMSTADRAIALLQDVFARNQVSVTCTVPAFTVWADEDKLLQVMINLLENAAIHGPSKGNITLSASINQEAARVRVSVQDQGTPLEANTIEKLFEPHARGKHKRVKGSGLGLYIVRSITQRWGGDAWGKALANGNEFSFSVGFPPSTQVFRENLRAQVEAVR